MSGYQGMRWFKCDLQVQTPEDGRHWDKEDPLRLPSPREELDLQDKARRYLRRCHEIGLEVIGVTDHNFCGHRKPRERFLTHLIEQNESVAEELGKGQLAIFPGFEVDIGFHVLCLFPPVRTGTALDDVCDVLTRLGLPPGERFVNGEPADLRRGGDYIPLSELIDTVQNRAGGLVIAAHAFEEDGIAFKDGKHRGDFRNEDLLCVEIFRFPLGPREESILSATQEAWARRRPPAFIQSSDAKSTLVGPDGEPKANSLGYRWTWIKMSEPSIEALRQAFLDPASRIRQRQELDPRVVRHDRIEALAVEGVKFLADQEVAFSPGLSCLIGGRGSGKSSLFEAIRFALRREDDPAAREQVDRIRKTMSSGSILRLRWREQDNSAGDPGPEDVFEYLHLGGRAQVASREVNDPSTVFQRLDLQIFSQREISAIAKEPGFLLRLIDGLVGPRLRALLQEETEVREEIQRLQRQQQTLERLQGEEKSLAQEVQELDRQWAARSAVQEEQQRQRAAQEADRHLEETAARAQRIATELDRWASDLVEAHAPLGSAVKRWPETAYFEHLDAEIERAKQQLASDLRAAAMRYQDRVHELTAGSGDWPKVKEAIQQADREFRHACAKRGLRPEDLAQLIELDQQRKVKTLELESKRFQASELRKTVASLSGAWRMLFEIWGKQTESREEEIRRILDRPAVPQVPKLVNGQQDGTRASLEMHVLYAADRDHFLAEWAQLAPDARTRLGRQWEELGNEACGQFSGSDRGSPWEIVESWRLGEIPLSPRLVDLREPLMEHLQRRKELWESKRLIRIQDAVDLVLYRNDGTEAGSLRRKELSDGQTNTALLMLLLASGSGPILIDQPEDELDSNFIFKQLVPLLREVKNHRQVIVVTHNPNLPVNADAELVYALQAQSVDGQARGVVRSQGGLDRPSVKDAVLDIMEGSEEAFRKRREKYHF